MPISVLVLKQLIIAIGIVFIDLDFNKRKWRYYKHDNNNKTVVRKKGDKLIVPLVKNDQLASAVSIKIFLHYLFYIFEQFERNNYSYVHMSYRKQLR